MSKILDNRLVEIKKLYYGNQLCMRQIAEKLDVSIDAVIYFMRKHKLKRRNFSEINRLHFERKSPSFKLRLIDSVLLRELKVIGTMLYWSEGYTSEKGSIVDFANSDPEMITIFLKFLRNIYEIDEKKLRILLYCYTDQDVDSLINFWSNLTGIPRRQFSKPYVRNDFRKNGRKMVNGLIHLRYCDKKLLLEVKKAIDYYKNKYRTNNAGVREVDKPSGL
ncbi:MAG: hypothetical protein US94_C0003G0011 [Berkelbacteria bacterium GW2011_GWB1_38_5]|uniref:Uncharacterized protein n=2 Tax=Candidatus Berkelbacteria TaxID=1618330 RepID=A0A0G0NYY4_9BACT|nr:MAG: hypothetical protein US94_C0003G0011 [Berkelbacteria bacterium GW2011_GWB1_38_5]KKQ91069.1 MAG: hypothetical protein UT15_C0001G0049 [Berkelbacteria bacterium GW2011_GWA1_39_10]